jgi:hypothetical protein
MGDSRFKVPLVPICDNDERFSLGGAARRPLRGKSPQLESATVSEKRIGLNRSPHRQGYGH